jgi:hypothetical protein
MNPPSQDPWPSFTRRAFLRTSAGAGLAGSFGGLAAFERLALAAGPDTSLTPDLVRLSPEIEPLVRLIEDTPRERCLETIVARLHSGLSYRELMAALYLAGIRNIDSQPPGSGFHAVFVIHSGHQLSLDAPVRERLLPLLWALDYFKMSQTRQRRLMRPLEEGLPPADRAWAELDGAMETWDADRAERAVAVLVRTRGAHEVIEGLWRYGARDYRSIGHKAIHTANTWRTLETIGWQHAEPAFRSLVRGLMTYGADRRVNGYVFEDQCYGANVERARRAAPGLPPNWAIEELTPEPDTAALAAILAPIRAGNADEACRAALDLLTKGDARAPALWDAVHLAAGELMMNYNGIGPLHSVTSTNALRYAFRFTADSQTRLLLLLQAIGWVAQFRHIMGDSTSIDILTLAPDRIASTPAAAANDILALASTDPAAAARQAMAYATCYPLAPDLLAGARHLVFMKSTEAHSYKYPAAVFEDLSLVLPACRPRMLAIAAVYLRGSTLPDSPLMVRAREAVRSL